MNAAASRLESKRGWLSRALVFASPHFSRADGAKKIAGG